jgi:glycosyltransferase involved in cell wall biosynthesis
MPKNPDKIKFSILILSIPTRFDVVRPLLKKLLDQIGDREDVEVLSLMDNKSFHIYEKRNELLKMCRGKYLAWLDDDDDVSDNYIETITKAIEDNSEADVISFNQTCFLSGKKARVFAAMGNPQEEVRLDPYDMSKYLDTLRMPWHWCVWKSSLAKSEIFREKYAHGNSGQSCEDIDWLDRLYPKVENSVYLKDDWLHIYRWSPETTESVL